MNDLKKEENFKKILLRELILKNLGGKPGIELNYDWFGMVPVGSGKFK